MIRNHNNFTIGKRMYRWHHVAGQGGIAALTSMWGENGDREGGMVGYLGLERNKYIFRSVNGSMLDWSIDTSNMREAKQIVQVRLAIEIADGIQIADGRET